MVRLIERPSMIKQGTSAAGPARATALSTAVILCGLALTSVILPSDGVVAIFTVAAYAVGLSLSLATGIEARGGVRGLIRTDILMLWVLYGLTFLEFLFPQPDVEGVVSVAAATSGTNAVLLGFAGLAIGRHLVPRRRQSGQYLSSFTHLRPGNVLLIFLFATTVGYLHILLAVNFDPFEMVRQMSLPRFSQSWGRGKYGDAYSLLYELGSLISLIPPLGGLIFARRDEYTLVQKIMVGLVLALTFYFGFSSGTRSIIVTYFMTFAGTFFLMKPHIKLGQALLWGVPALLLLLMVTTYMLEFREVGLTNYSFSERHYGTLFIDNNIVNVSQLTQVFPNVADFLGMEIPLNAIIRPIPRFFWPGKPEGLSISIESALGVTGEMTLSCTFIGEAYIAGGLFAVGLAGLLFGMAAGWWNRVGRNVESPLAQLLYASGFVCAALAMRSMLAMVPVMLPTLALWVFVRYWLPRGPSYRSPHTITRNKS
jgi:oligosaccharide repeat unit polymerase